MRSEAMATVERALAINPNDADALIDRGQFLQAQGRLEEAIVSYGSGLKFSPKNLSALNNLGACLLLKAQPAQAIPYFQAAAAAMPTSPKPPNNIGAALKEVGQIDQAIVQFRRAIEIDPTYADAHCNLGGAYASLADHEAAIAAYRRTLEIDPAFAGVGSNLLLAMLSPADISAAQLLAEHKAWNDQHAMQLTRAAASHGSIHLVARRLRVGYVSPDFREHSVRYFIEPIFAAHDRSRFEVFAYATGRRRDAVSNLLAGLVEHWHPVAELNDAQLADLIRSHGIDILIDLAGHTSDNRLLSFARRPAPVQITYLGYPTTTGMPAIDFRITDAVCDPPGADGFYAEKLIRMPNAFFVYQDDSGKPFDPALPADRNGHFTFGSFNSFTKINDQTLTAWANILQAVSGSRLLMKARPVENPSTREKLLGFFTQRGIATDRIDLRAWVTLPEHFAMLAGGIDLMLDTFPYNGHTTSCQSIWMGVPMVTRSGDSFRSRVGETMLNQLNLMELVARDWNEYEKIAVKLASDWSTLRQLRPTLRDRMRKSTLCDAAGFTRTLESHFISALRQVPSPA
jgi:predicted O-linked N-acetylglucosamine transferase (SPINDLY family)